MSYTLYQTVEGTSIAYGGRSTFAYIVRICPAHPRDFHHYTAFLSLPKCDITLEADTPAELAAGINSIKLQFHSYIHTFRAPSGYAAKNKPSIVRGVMQYHFCTFQNKAEARKGDYERTFNRHNLRKAYVVPSGKGQPILRSGSR